MGGLELSIKFLKPGVVYIDMNYIKKSVGALTPDQVTEKSFKVGDWMDRNPDNKWVQQVGKDIISRLNAMYTQDQATIH